MSSTDAIVDTLRGRILRGLKAGTLVPGARLPSTRELNDEFRVDHRAILAAYRALATEGLIDIRERDGLIDVTTGCCTNVSDDCSTFTVRFIKQSDREWNVVDTHELVP